MKIKELNERGFTTNKDGLVLDEYGNEYRNEEGNIEYCENCGEELKDKIIGDVCPKCDKIYGVER